MNNVLRRPERMFDLARLYTASVASTLIWGQRTKDLDSFWYKEFYELMDLVRDSHFQLLLAHLKDVELILQKI